MGKVVGIIKANTARMPRKKFPFLSKLYWKHEGLWPDGYFVSTVGANEAQIKEYIEKQGEEDFGQTKFEMRS